MVTLSSEKNSGERHPVYVLHIAPGADRCLLRTSDEAVAQALVFAKCEHVRVWLTDQGYDFVLFEDFRPVESV